MRKLSFAVAMIALVASAFAPVEAAGTKTKMIASEEGQIVFVTPSGNIGCTYTPKGGTSFYEPRDGGPELICERVEPTYVTVIIGPKGLPHRIDNPGEQACCSLDQKLAYGRRWSEGPFTCQSEKTGLMCKSSNGHGFSMNKAGVKVW